MATTGESLLRTSEISVVLAVAGLGWDVIICRRVATEELL